MNTTGGEKRLKKEYVPVLKKLLKNSKCSICDLDFDFSLCEDIELLTCRCAFHVHCLDNYHYEKNIPQVNSILGYNRCCVCPVCKTPSLETLPMIWCCTKGREKAYIDLLCKELENEALEIKKVGLETKKREIVKRFLREYRTTDQIVDKALDFLILLHCLIHVHILPCIYISPYHFTRKEYENHYNFLHQLFVKSKIMWESFIRKDMCSLYFSFVWQLQWMSTVGKFLYNLDLDISSFDLRIEDYIPFSCVHEVRISMMISAINYIKKIHHHCKHMMFSSKSPSIKPAFEFISFARAAK